MSYEESVNENDGIVSEQTEQSPADNSVSEPAASVDEKAIDDNGKSAQSDSIALPEKTVKPAKQAKPKKPVKQSSMTADAKRKLFKMIYYPVLALFVVLMFVFSAIDGVVGYSPEQYDDGYYQAVTAHVKSISESPRSAMSPSTNDSGIEFAREYLLTTLVNGGFKRVNEQKSERKDVSGSETLEKITTITEYGKNDGVDVPTVTVQTSTLDGNMQSSLGLPEYIAGANITNIVAAIPSGNNNSGAIVLTVRYDSRIDTVGAASNAAFTATAMQSLIEYVKSGKKFDNDIVVVFTEDLDMSYGAYAFFNAFKGFGDVVSRAKAGISLDAYGTSGTLALTDASNAGLDYINAYTKASGNVFNSSIVHSAIPSVVVNKHAVKAFGSIPAVQVAVIGGTEGFQSSLDNIDNLSQSIIRQQSDLIKRYIDKFGASSDVYSAAGSDDMVFFSYLDGGTVAYTAVASYVIGVLILAMIAGVITAMILKKTFSIKNMFIALGVQLLVIVSTLVAMIAMYFMVTLMLTGFGVLPIHAITRVRYINAGIVIAAILATIAASFGFTTLYKKLFRVTSSDMVRGTAMLFGFTGAVMSFNAPAYSFMTSWLGLTMLGVLLASVCLHKRFKAKFGLGMDRLYLYAIPAALCLPFVMAEVTAVAGLLPLVLLPIVMTVFTAVLGIGIPYLDRTQPLLDKLVKKLPMRTVRVERMVTEKVEDRAKKGKFTEKTYKKVSNEKVALNYKNYFGISVVSVLGIVIALFSGGFGVTFDKTLTKYYAYNDGIYNDSIVYEVNLGSSGNTQKIVVGDLMAYKHIRYAITDLVWDGEKNNYSKTVKYNLDETITRTPNITKSDNNSYTVTTFDGARSNVVLTIPSANRITKITVKESYKNDGDYEGYTYEFENQDKIVLRLPYGFDSTFVMTIDGANPTKFEYEEYRTVAITDSALDNIDEWNKIKYNSDLTGLRGGIVIKGTISV